MLTKSFVRVSLAAVVTTMLIGCGGGEDPADPTTSSSSEEAMPTRTDCSRNLSKLASESKLNQSLLHA